jgi:AcrR family transcriptional regulator
MSSGIANAPVATARGPQRQRGRDRVAGLMAAAAELFVAKGYDATTMTEIAARAGASIGSLYLFFPTKPVLAQSMLSLLSDRMSAQLDALQARSAGWDAATLADAVFDELEIFLTGNPVYTVLIDVPGDDEWRAAVRRRRRQQIAAIFAQAVPTLPDGQAERLAVIIPQFMRMTIMIGGEPLALRVGVAAELRAMLRHHLKADAR